MIYRMFMQEDLRKDRLPAHIAVIMDGNGRWAEQRHKDRVFGHQHGVGAVREICEASAELGIKYLTLFTFSTENWSRPAHEVSALMNLLVVTLIGELDTLMKNQISFQVFGDLDRLPSDCIKQLLKTSEMTMGNPGMQLNLAISYSARWEIVNAARLLSRQVKEGLIDPEEIDEKMLGSFMLTHSMPDPELLIRTSGEKRISNFMLWQLAYSELFFSEKCWPDFTKEDLYLAISDYQSRERRFGLTSQQIQKLSK